MSGNILLAFEVDPYAFPFCNASAGKRRRHPRRSGFAATRRHLILRPKDLRLATFVFRRGGIT